MIVNKGIFHWMPRVVLRIETLLPYDQVTVISSPSGSRSRQPLTAKPQLYSHSWRRSQRHTIERRKRLPAKLRTRGSYSRALWAEAKSHQPADHLVQQLQTSKTKTLCSTPQWQRLL